MPPRKVSVVFGTRPEAIKMLPVVRALRARPEEFECRVVATGQHRQMLDQVLAVFGTVPDADLDLMEPGQELERIFTRAVMAMKDELAATRPDMVLVEGDTTTVFATALAAFWRGCPVGHVEAGLRSGDVRNPFPEEMNRILAGCLSDLHFAPTRDAAGNLLRAGVPEARIFVTGNTVIDALRATALAVKDRPCAAVRDARSRVVLVTVHRRESFGEPLGRVLAALAQIVKTVPDIEIVLPVHPNPRVYDAVHAALGNVPRVHLLAPLDYLDFVAYLEAAHLVLSDSGGVQEEAPALGTPVLVLRETTERPEGIHAGVARLVGTDTARIVGEAVKLLGDGRAYAAMARAVNPYGDGRASERIVAALRHHFGMTAERPADFAPAAAGKE